MQRSRLILKRDWLPPVRQEGAVPMNCDQQHQPARGARGSGLLGRLQVVIFLQLLLMVPLPAPWVNRLSSWWERLNGADAAAVPVHPAQALSDTRDVWP